jgi:hypothetical protein
MPPHQNRFHSRAVTAVWVALLDLPLVACGGQTDDAPPAAPPSGEAPSTAPGVEEPATTENEQTPDRVAAAEGELRAGLRVLAQEWQQAAEGASPIAHERLLDVLPEVAGWTRLDHRSERVNLPVPHSAGRAIYERDGQRISVVVTDTAMSQLLLSPFSMFLDAGFEEHTDGGFIRAIKVADSPGFEEWNGPRRRGEVVVVVGGRYLLKATGTNIPAIDTVRGVVSRLRIS